MPEESNCNRWPWGGLAQCAQHCVWLLFWLVLVLVLVRVRLPNPWVCQVCCCCGFRAS